ncbi:GlxA family transcriptional regulator [Shimia thalassica]|uniref:GlxA family transcriptional regulator n=1 Tax=Shimia thalassica TaxID=1715693 RepID=UPI0026E38191|nr:GlxA family transcriptional regulator [Shimia thalassica]MDO6520342.1 GlxA family transcriptional regulator [Shimia thalassica]
MSLFKIAFVLVDGFALLSTAAALEPLRAANMFSDPPRYDITLLSDRDSVAKSSIGAQFETHSFRECEPDFDLIFVVAGGDPARMNDPSLFAWLRRADRAGVALGGISGGSVILARADLLNQHRFTVHWHHYEDFETLPGNWLLERRLFVIDRDRYTCAGGSAPLDMMHAIIARDFGTPFAQRISDWFIQTEVRGAEAPQTASISARYGVLPRPVSAALELMETHIADPLDQDQIAHLSGLSTRQLQRQFRGSFGTSLMETYRRIRLETGQELLLSSNLSVGEIARMTGFSSQAHFSDSFRRTFGITPSAKRKKTGPT